MRTDHSLEVRFTVIFVDVALAEWLHYPMNAPTDMVFTESVANIILPAEAQT